MKKREKGGVGRRRKRERERERERERIGTLISKWDISVKA